MKKQFFLFFSIFLLLGVHGKAQSTNINELYNKVLTKMVAEGFQSVSIKKENDSFYLAYENRVYRYEVMAIKKIIQLVAPIIGSDATKLILITKKQQIPVLNTTLELADYSTFQNGLIDKTTFINRLVMTQKKIPFKKGDWAIFDKNTSQYKIEIEVEPDLNLVLGGAPDPILHQLNLIPAVNLYLWKGAQFKFQAILPISNEIAILEETFVRPGILSFSQQIRLPSNLFAALSVGYFSAYRYGSALDLTKYLFNGKLVLRGHLGYTGYASYPKRLGVDEPEKVWQYADIGYTDYKVSMDYFIAKWNLQAGVEYGKVLYNKKMIGIHVTQNFKELKLGFFSFKTDDGYNYGVKLAIPIMPKKYWNPKQFSIKPSSHLNYTYYTTEQYISQYNTGKYDNFHNQSLTPNQIQNLLEREDWN